MGTFMMDDVEQEQIYCNYCAAETRHLSVSSRKYHRRETQLRSAEWGEYVLWACAGCDTCTMDERYSSDAMIDHFENEDAEESRYLPERNQGNRQLRHFPHLPHKLGRIYFEVVRSYNERLPVLCAVGLRLLLEGICADKQLNGTNLLAKISEMKKLMPGNIADNLHFLRIVGNKAAHELEAPQQREVEQAIEVLEDVLNFLYELPHKAGQLGKRDGFVW
jgi:hypothetical protein